MRDDNTAIPDTDIRSLPPSLPPASIPPAADALLAEASGSRALFTCDGYWYITPADERYPAYAVSGGDSNGAMVTAPGRRGCWAACCLWCGWLVGWLFMAS